MTGQGNSPSSVVAPAARVGVSIVGARLDFAGTALFDGLALELPAGTWTCLVGPSGVGKTTLLRLVAGLADPSPGTIVAAGDGKPLAGRVAWMAQQDLLLPWLDVLGNVLLGARLRGETPDRERAMALLAEVGLADRTGARPRALSGGERQRVALARTLMEDRPVVLMDEPFSALDAITRARLQEMARRLLAGRTVLLVTHDPMEALRLGDRVVVLAGRPATLSPALDVPGTPPRPLTDPALLALYQTLLQRLAATPEPVA
ncbi:MAG: ABC transporter ATP-binding protein [Alphaproteobacteria bacterium]